MANTMSFAIYLHILPFIAAAVLSRNAIELNSSPIIAIIAEDTTHGPGSSYISADYVKFLESGGARVVPIPTSASPELVKEIFSKVNGVLFPGGDEAFRTSAFYKNAKFIFDLAIEANDNGQFFPIWSTCLGFQTVLEIMTGTDAIISSSDTSGVAYPLNFTEHVERSRMFSEMPLKQRKLMATEDLTMNSHRNCVSHETFEKNEKLNTFFHVLSTNTDPNGKTFVSTIEAIHYPFYGTQWHPEKNSFDFMDLKPNGLRNIPHSADAVRVTQYFANFFVDEARKSAHRFANWWEEEVYMIYKYKTTHTGLLGHVAEQKYYFG